jgi:hypothetical protein
MNIFRSIYKSVSKNLLDSIDGSTAGIVSGGSETPPEGFLLLENNDFLLLETGDKILLG